MIDYNYYITVFDGKKIKSEEQFELYKDRAIRYVNMVTSKKGSEKEISDAVCALCDLYSETTASVGVINETVDGISVKYDNDRIDKMAYATLKLYLPSRLLYRGL